jgi:hypothetical protein
MKEYLLLLRGGRPISKKSEVDRKAEMQAWGAYVSSLSGNGQFAGGLPLHYGGAVVSAKGATPEPVKSAPEGIVGGYLIIKADNLTQAIGIANDCPHIANYGNIEVREIVPMPGM